MTVSDGVSPSPRGGGGAGSAPSKSVTGLHCSNNNGQVKSILSFCRVGVGLC